MGHVFKSIQSFIGAFNPFILKLIIDKYMLLIILLIVFWLKQFSVSSSPDLFPCGLLGSFSALFEFLSLNSLYIFCRFLVCGYHRFYISAAVYFNLIVT